MQNRQIKDLKDIKMQNRQKDEYKRREEEHAKEVLKQHIKTKFTTTIIGCLDRFEQRFGRYWKHGEPTSKLDHNEQVLREIWKELRVDILDHGNDQMRAALDEIDQYTVKYNKFRYEFVRRER